jgi:hypothetical protein
LKEREIYTHAALQEPIYMVQSAMVVHASLSRTRQILTRFDLFAGKVPYIERSEYDSQTKRLRVAGGIWKYRLESTLQFEPESRDRWNYRIVEGHFQGMAGALTFQELEPGQTWVSFEGRYQGVPGAKFPPKVIIEQGFQIIFAVTGRRVRSLVEDRNFEPQDAVTRAQFAQKMETRNDSKKPSSSGPSRNSIPEPRSGLGQPER